MNPMHYVFKMLATPVIGAIFGTAGWVVGGLKLAVILGVLGVTAWLVYAAYIVYTVFEARHAPANHLREASSVGRATLLQSEGHRFKSAASHQSFQDLMMALSISMLMAFIHALDRTLVAFGQRGMVIR